MTTNECFVTWPTNTFEFSNCSEKFKIMQNISSHLTHANRRLTYLLLNLSRDPWFDQLKTEGCVWRLNLYLSRAIDLTKIIMGTNKLKQLNNIFGTTTTNNLITEDRGFDKDVMNRYTHANWRIVESVLKTKGVFTFADVSNDLICAWTFQ